VEIHNPLESLLLTHLASPDLKGKKLPLCHTAMIPWTAEFIGQEEGDMERVLKVARNNKVV
jgi:TatD DNase family protein